MCGGEFDSGGSKRVSRMNDHSTFCKGQIMTKYPLRRWPGRMLRPYMKRGLTALSARLLCVPFRQQRTHHDLNLVVQHDGEHDQAKAWMSRKQNLGHGQAGCQAFLGT